MQAARGTSLSSGDPSASPASAGSPARPAPRRIKRWFAVTALTAYAVDVATKVAAVELLAGRPDVEVVGRWLTLHLTRNPGAAFGTATEYTLVLSLIAVAAIAVVLSLSRRLASRWWAVGLGLLLAGVAGNLTDRLLREPGPMRGHVVDFLRLPNFPVFNVADILINIAAGIIVVQAFRGVRIDGSRDRSGGPVP